MTKGSTALDICSTPVGIARICSLDWTFKTVLLQSAA